MSRMFDFATEITILIGTMYFVFTKQDIRFVIYGCTLYLAAVIRHSGQWYAMRIEEMEDGKND